MTPMDPAIGVAELTAALKACLRARGMTYASLAKRLRLSEASVKRVFSARSFTLQRLDEICAVLGVDFYELARLAREQDQGDGRLTVAQERALAGESKLLVLFLLLLNGWRRDEVVKDYAFTTEEIARMLVRLEALELVRLQPDGEARLRTSRVIEWRPDGPVRRAYKKRVMGEFFRSDFADARADLRFDGYEMSAASIELVKRKIQRLSAEFKALADIDATLEHSARTTMGLVLALRPYLPFPFTRFKRRRR
jgi:transcriptional regulator with XRE-family HTH domain